MSSNKVNQKSYFIAMMGTTLEYYDMSLYSFMAPILITQFLPNLDPLTALILAFAMYPLSIFSKPIGALVIGRIGDKLGRKKALTTAIFGIALTTGIIGCLPTYHQIGIAAPILFTLCRIMQKFFGAGEYNGGAIYLLEHMKEEKKGYISGLYCAYTVLGIILAAIVSTIVSYLPLSYWRLPYFIGFFTGIFGFYIRAKAIESPEFVHSETYSLLNYDLIRSNIKKIVSVIGMAAFFGCLYTIPAILLTSLVPLISNLSSSTVMFINVITLFIYMICLPISGYIADKIGLTKSMIAASLATIITTLVFIKLLYSNSLFTILMVKSIFAIISAWYIGPFHAAVQSMFTVNTRYRLISLSYSIGSQIGGAMPAVSLFIWKKSQNLMFIGFVLIFWATIGAISCFVARKIQIDQL